MIISSELTGKTYKTVEDCLKAEREYREQKKKEEEAKKVKREELNKAYEEAIKACNKYLELVGAGSVAKLLSEDDVSDFDKLFDYFFELS